MRRTIGICAGVVVVAALAIWFARGRKGHDRGTQAGRETTRAGATRGGERAEKEILAPAWFGQAGAPARRVAGRVTYHGESVAGARVSLYSHLVTARLIQQPVVLTDDAGRFDLGEWPAGRWTITAESAGRSAGLWLELADPTHWPAPDRLELALHDCDAAVYGTVEDASGGPVAGARMRVYAGGVIVTETDQQGRYDVCVPRGEALIRVDAEEYAITEATVKAYSRMRQDITLVPAVSIRGQVVRQEDGAPVAGAWILASPTYGSAAERAMKGVTAGDDGMFVVPGLRAGRYQLEVEAEGLVSARPVEVTIGLQGEHDPVVCRMERAQKLTGVVLEGDRPVAGAAVSVAGSGFGDRVFSQADGTFAIDHLRPGTIGLFVYPHELLEPKEVTIDARNPTHVILQVASQAVIRGRVMHRGKPVADGAVRALGKGPDSGQRGSSGSVLGDGTFELRGLAPGMYELYAESPEAGAFTKGKPITVSKGQVVEGVVVELDLAASIAGTVVDELGAPVAGATVRFALIGGRDQGIAGTAEDGTFVARSMSGGGEYTASVRAPNGVTTYQPAAGGEWPRVTLRDGTSQVTGVRLTVRRPSLTITGRVVRTGGAPVADASLTATSWERNPYGQTVAARANSAVDGTFTLNELAAGDYRVRALAGTLVDETRVAAGASDVVLTLPEGGAVEGTLIGFAPDVTVSVSGGSHGWNNHQVTPAGGKFRIGDLEPGRYSVRASDPNGSAAVRIELAPGQVAQVTLESGKLAQFDGRLIDLRTGKPMAGRICDCNHQVDPAKVVTGTDGRFSMSIPAGLAVRVSCHPENWRGDAHAEVMLTAARGERLERVVYGLVQNSPDHQGDAGIRGLGFDLGISALLPNGPAEAAGLQVNDRILAVENVSVVGAPFWIVLAFIGDHAPGDAVAITVDRSGKRMDFQVKLGEPQRFDYGLGD